MNFVTNLLLNKFKNVIYNAILIIINQFIKIVKYLFIKITIDVAILTKVFYNKIIYRYNILNDIVND